MNFKIKSTLALLTLVVSGQLHAMPKFVEGSYTCKDSNGTEFLSSLAVRNNEVSFSALGSPVPGYAGLPCLNQGDLGLTPIDQDGGAVAFLFECNETRASAATMKMDTAKGTIEGSSVSYKLNTDSSVELIYQWGKVVNDKLESSLTINCSYN